MKDTETRLYSIWKYMRGRCNNPNNTSFHNYGGRGIKVCEDWNTNFSSFKKWALANDYSDNLSIDRINPDGNYEPDNCRWGTAFVQAANTRKIHKSNKSGYRGVSLNTNGKWEVSIQVEKITIKIGYYTDIIEAAKAYDTYIIDHNLPHTPNNILADGERAESNIGQTLISSNTSGFRGVTAPKRIAHMKNNWQASIQHKGKKIWSGYFASAEEAAKARDKYIIDNNLPHKLNFP